MKYGGYEEGNQYSNSLDKNNSKLETTVIDDLHIKFNPSPNKFFALQTTQCLFTNNVC